MDDFAVKIAVTNPMALESLLMTWQLNDLGRREFASALHVKRLKSELRAMVN